MNRHKYMLEPMVYRCGPYCIRKFKGGWQWERSDKSVVDDHVYQTVYEAQIAIDKYECQLEHDNATEQGQYATAEKLAKRMGATFEPASVPEQERYAPEDYVTSPPPMDAYPTKFKAPKLEDGEHYARYFERVMQSVEDYINERWS